MLAFKTKIPYFFIDWFIILNEEKFSAKSGCKSPQKDESPKWLIFIQEMFYSMSWGRHCPPGVHVFVNWDKPICEDIIIVLNLLKLKVLKIIVILLGISKKVVTLSFALNDDYGKHFTDIKTGLLIVIFRHY